MPIPSNQQMALDLAQWPVFHPGYRPATPMKKSIALPRARARQQMRREKEKRRHRTRRRVAQQRAVHRRRCTVYVGPRPRPRAPVFKPLLPRHAASSPFSFCALQTLPTPFPKRLVAIKQKGKSPFEEFETARQRTHRVALEKRWAGSRPTFYEQLVLDLAKDHRVEMRLRFWFRALLAAWRYRVYARRNGSAPPMDPVTLEPIRVPVKMVDYKAKRLFVFEASALNQLVRQALLYQLYTVPDPQFPKNPFTNVRFTYGQLVGLHRALQRCGCLSQEFHMLRAAGFSLKRFKLLMGPWLYMEAQRQELYDLSSEDGQQLLGDFMVECLEDLGRLPDQNLEGLVRDAVEMVPGHEMLCRMRALCLREIEAQLFQTPNRQAILTDFYLFFKSRSDLWLLVRRKREALSRDAEATEH